MEKYRKTLTKDVDLGRPLQLNNIQGLLKVCTQERAQKVLDLMIANSEGTCDDPNSTTNNLPTTEMIINQLPPGTIPIDWVVEQTPAMMPRFFSIVSMVITSCFISILSFVHTLFLSLSLISSVIGQHTSFR